MKYTPLKPLLLLGLIAEPSLAQRDAEIQSVAVGDSITVTYHSSIPRGRYYIPTEFDVAIVYNKPPHNPMLSFGDQHTKSLQAGKDSVTYIISAEDLRTISALSKEFDVRWGTFSLSRFGICPFYPLPQIAFHQEKGRTPTFYEPVTVSIGPLLRQPQHIVLLDSQKVHYPVTILREWQENDPSVELTCAFGWPSRAYSLQLLDRQKPFQFLRIAPDHGPAKNSYVLYSSDVIDVPFPAIPLKQSNRSYMTLMYNGTPLHAFVENRKIDPVNVRYSPGSTVQQEVIDDFLRTEIGRTGHIEVRRRTGVIGRLTRSLIAPHEEKALQLATTFVSGGDRSPSFVLYRRSQGSPLVQDTLWLLLNLVSRLDAEDVSIDLGTPSLFPGDTVRLNLIAEEEFKNNYFEPSFTVDGLDFQTNNNTEYTASIPEWFRPGKYPIVIRPIIPAGRTTGYETNVNVIVKEFRRVEDLSRYVRMIPDSGSPDPAKPQSISRESARMLAVALDRYNISPRMGLQFIRIRTTIHSREEELLASRETRAITFRAEGDKEQDAKIYQDYLETYFPYAVVNVQELETVTLQFDTLPDWSSIKIQIEPDYDIKKVPYDHHNLITRYYLVKGSQFESSLSLGIPKVLYDTNTDDPVDYGSVSAMVRFSYLDEESGNRLPVNFGIGTFGVDSPIDVSKAGGGFAVSFLLDVIQAFRLYGADLPRKITAGLEITPFFPLQHKSRVLVNVKLGYSP